MQISRKILLAVAVCCLSYSASGQTTFAFHTGSALSSTGIALNDSTGSAQNTIDGITLTAEALLDGLNADADFYGTSSSFGIDNNNTNISGFDDSDRFDNLGGVETMVFSFNVDGIFQSIDLRFIEGGADEAQLIFDGGPTFELNLSTDTGGTTDMFNISQSFAANQLITLRLSPDAEVSENFSLESFTVVPEPRTIALVAGISALGFVMLRHRAK